MRRVVLLAAPVLVAGAVAALVLAGDDGDGEARAERGAAGVVAVERRTLVDSALVAGTLGYADERVVTNRLGGTVTWLPAAGSIVRTGETLLKVDGRPVVLLDGEVPAYRELRSGVSEGADVLQLERNLRTLGHTSAGTDVDRRWDADTTAAVRRWQRARGLDDTGVVELGRVAFMPGARRITTREVEVGSAGAGGAGGSAAVGTRGGSTALAALGGLWAATLGGTAAQAQEPQQPTTGTTTDPTTTTTAPATTTTMPATTAPATTTPTPTPTPRPTTTTTPGGTPAPTTGKQGAAPTRPAAAGVGGRGGGGLGGAAASGALGGASVATTGAADTAGAGTTATAVLTTTSTRRVVAVDLDVADQDLVAVGRRVDVELPDGRTVPGAVARVGTVATAPQGTGEAAGGAADEAGDPTVEVTIRLTGKEQGGRLDQAPVSVSLRRETRRGVLVVPVTALVARRGGGYAVERVGAGGARALVDVEPGLFADGDVEILRGVREGDRVAVPQ